MSNSQSQIRHLHQKNNGVLTTRDQLFIAVINRLHDYQIASVAECAGITETTLYYWLQGKVLNPHSSTLFAVAEAIGFEITWRQQRMEVAA